MRPIHSIMKVPGQFTDYGKSQQLQKVLRSLELFRLFDVDRDAFIELLRNNELMVQIKRRRHYKTTDSSHHYHKYDNLIKEIIPSHPNEIWVSV